MDDRIVGLDIGTSKVTVVIGERNENGVIEITGVGTSPSSGCRKGVIINIEAAINAITEAVEAAEVMSGQEVRSCWCGIGGSEIEGLNSRGVVAIAGPNREICRDDIVRVTEAARAVTVPMDRQIIQTIPQSYIVDDHKGIREPLGMIGVRLESEVHIITVAVTTMKNLVKCVNRAGLFANDFLLLQVLAAGRAVLTPQEQELGVVLLDIGGGTTDVMVYFDGAPYSTFTVPIGGGEVTKDISMIKSISVETAENIKHQYGCCWEDVLDDEDILIPGIANRPPMTIPGYHIYRIVRPRMEEIFELVKNRLDYVNLPRPLSGGVVLTGGGASLNGAAELAGEVFKMPARIGTPMRCGNLGGLVDGYCTPEYSTAIGLVLEGDVREREELFDREGAPRSSPSKGARKPGVAGKIVNWMRNGLF